MADETIERARDAFIGVEKKEYVSGKKALAVFDMSGRTVSSEIIDGSMSITTAKKALNNGVSQEITEVVVTNLDAAITIFIGNGTSQSTPISPGMSVVIPIDDLNKVFVRAASGTPSVAWLGRV